jgi:subfamily B ATP-binding cassette protein MsbA
MKRLFELITPHYKLLLVALICSLFVSAANGLFAYAVKPIVDDIFVQGDRQVLMLASLAIIVVFLIRGVFIFIQNYLMFEVGAKIVKNIRDDLYHHIVYFPMKQFGRDTSGMLLSKVINDAGLLQELLAYRMRDLFVSIFTIIVLTAVALYRRWDLTLIALLVLPFAFYLVGIIGRKLKHVSKNVQKQLAHITESLGEGLTGIKVIKSFVMEDKEALKFQDKTKDYYKLYLKSTWLIQLTTFIMEVVAGVGVAFIIYYGGYLVSNGEMTVGEFFSFLTAIMLIFTPAKRLAQVHNGLQQAKAYVGRIDEVLHSEKEHDGNVDAKLFSSKIVYDHVSFRHEGREEYALTDISLEINKGEVLAFVGKSGSGKSTFVDLLARFHMPQEGVITFDGNDINTLTAKSLRGQVGIVSQNVFLFNDSIKANITFGKEDATEEDVINASKAAFAHEFILELPDGYDTMIGEGGQMLSGGQRQRISIARAILSNPPVLILDEATSSLDSQSEHMVQMALDNLMDAGVDGSSDAKTIVVIAHRLSTIQRATRIVVLDEGRVQDVGTHDELLLKEGIYRHLYMLQHGAPELPDASDI